MLASAQSLQKFPPEARSCIDTGHLPAHSLWFVARHWANVFPVPPGLGQPVAPSGNSPEGYRINARMPRWADLPG